MDYKTLVQIRNVLATSEGKLILSYLSDIATDLAMGSFDALQLKGFCRAIEELKRVPEKVESINNKK